MKPKTLALISAMVIATITVSAYYYTILPNTVPTHWNASGKVDSYGSKLIPVLIMPIVVLLLGSLTVILPKLSPKQFEIEKFQDTYENIMIIVTGLMTYLQVVILNATANPKVDIGKWLVSGILLFLAWMGNLMGKTRRNFYMGIRTPWTLASDKVWVATHRLGGKLMVIGGLGGAIGCFIGIPPLPCMFGAMILLLYPVIFSYQYYKKLEEQGELDT